MYMHKNATCVWKANEENPRRCSVITTHRLKLFLWNNIRPSTSQESTFLDGKQGPHTFDMHQRDENVKENKLGRKDLEVTY